MKAVGPKDSVPPKVVVCPTCGGRSIYSGTNLFRPFCSERCKSIDFGAWASERFRVPAPSLPDQQVDHDTH